MVQYSLTVIYFLSTLNDFKHHYWDTISCAKNKINGLKPIVRLISIILTLHNFVDIYYMQGSMPYDLAWDSLIQECQ